jgi:hypothetical protein
LGLLADSATPLGPLPCDRGPYGGAYCLGAVESEGRERHGRVLVGEVRYPFHARLVVKRVLRDGAVDGASIVVGVGIFVILRVSVWLGAWRLEWPMTRI